LYLKVDVHARHSLRVLSYFRSSSVLILNFLKGNLPCVVSCFIYSECYAKIQVPALGLRKLAFPFRLWWLNTNCLLASFTWVKATPKWLFPLLLVIVQPCSGPCLVKGLNQKRTRLIALIFSHCNLMGGKVSLLPWCIASWLPQSSVPSLLHDPFWRGSIFK